MVAYPPLEPAKGSAAAALHSVPPAILLFVLLAALAADPENVAVSSTSILTSSSFKPGTSSAVKTWASASPSIDAHAGECCSLRVGGDAREDAAAVWIGS